MSKRFYKEFNRKFEVDNEINIDKKEKGTRDEDDEFTADFNNRYNQENKVEYDETFMKEMVGFDFSDKSKIEKYRDFVRYVLKKDESDITKDEKATFILFLTKEMIHEDGKKYIPSMNYSNAHGTVAKAVSTVLTVKGKTYINSDSRIHIYYENLDRRAGVSSANIPQIINLMHVVPHEYRHLTQTENTLNGTMDINSLNVTLDNLYRRSMTPKEYHRNWINMEFERDAEIYGYNKVKEMLARYATEKLSMYEAEINSIINILQKAKSNKTIRIQEDGKVYEVEKNKDRDEFIKSKILEDKDEIESMYSQVFDLYNEKGEKRTKEEINELMQARIKQNPEQEEKIRQYFGDIIREFEIGKEKNQEQSNDDTKDSEQNQNETESKGKKYQNIELNEEQINLIMNDILIRKLRKVDYNYKEYEKLEQKMYEEARNQIGIKDPTKDQLKKFIAEKEYNKSQSSRVYMIGKDGEKIMMGVNYDNILNSARQAYLKAVTIEDIDKSTNVIEDAYTQQNQENTKPDAEKDSAR